MAKIKILLIEDNRLLREGITAMLNDHGDFKVIAKSEDGDAVRQLKGLGLPPRCRPFGSGAGKSKRLEADGRASGRIAHGKDIYGDKIK